MEIKVGNIPKRTKVTISAASGDAKVEKCECLDCSFSTPFLDEMIFHQENYRHSLLKRILRGEESRLMVFWGASLFFGCALLSYFNYTKGRIFLSIIAAAAALINLRLLIFWWNKCTSKTSRKR